MENKFITGVLIILGFAFLGINAHELWHVAAGGGGDLCVNLNGVDEWNSDDDGRLWQKFFFNSVAYVYPKHSYMPNLLNEAIGYAITIGFVIFGTLYAAKRAKCGKD